MLKRYGYLTWIPGLAGNPDNFQGQKRSQSKFSSAARRRAEERLSGLLYVLEQNDGDAYCLTLTMGKDYLADNQFISIVKKLMNNYWQQTAPDFWCYGFWEYQKRGALHCHVLMPATADVQEIINLYTSNPRILKTDTSKKQTLKRNQVLRNADSYPNGFAGLVKYLTKDLTKTLSKSKQTGGKGFNTSFMVNRQAILNLLDGLRVEEFHDFKLMDDLRLYNLGYALSKEPQHALNQFVANQLPKRIIGNPRSESLRNWTEIAEQFMANNHEWLDEWKLNFHTEIYQK